MSTDFDKEGFRRRVRAVRDHFSYPGESLRSFARRVGWDRTHWLQMEQGKRLPGTETLARFSRLGVDLCWLVTGVSCVERRGNVGEEP